MNMTEASGLRSDQERIEHVSEAIRDMTDEMKENSAPLTPGSRPVARRLSEQVRQMAREIPLQSLLIAFLLGVLVARHR